MWHYLRQTCSVPPPENLISKHSHPPSVWRTAVEPQRLIRPLHYHKSYQLNEMERRTPDLGNCSAGLKGRDPTKPPDFIGLFYYLNVPALEPGGRGDSLQQSTTKKTDVFKYTAGLYVRTTIISAKRPSRLCMSCQTDQGNFWESANDTLDKLFNKYGNLRKTVTEIS